jgi:hypothetical protein
MSFLKKLTVLLITAVSIAAFGATLNPIQLLNPAGSSSGQAIVSTGASTAPAWGGVGVNGIASIAANTVLANATGSAASPTAFAMPSCSATGNALNWTTSTGFTCQTGLATLASPTFTGTVTTAALTATGLITPSTTNGIKGTTLADNANTGSVGEYPSASTSATSLSNNTPANATSVSLPAGDWEVQCVAQFNPAGSTVPSLFIAGVNTVSATRGAFQTENVFQASIPAGAGNQLPTPLVRINVSSTTTAYCVVQAAFTVSTMTVNGYIWARRMR